MAIVKWAPGIDSVSGLLSKRPKAGTAHSSHQSALLATHRTAATTNTDCTRIYMVGEYKRSTVPQAKELAARARFASVAAAVKARSKDLMQQATDITNFLAQKDTAGGKKTTQRLSARMHGRKRSLRRSLFLYKNIQTLAYVIFFLYFCTRFYRVYGITG